MPCSEPWWTYMLVCDHGGLYVGVTNDVARRYERHRRGVAARFTRLHKPVGLIALERFDERSGATQRERKLKRLTRDRKFEWAEAHRPDAIDLQALSGTAETPDSRYGAKMRSP